MLELKLLNQSFLTGNEVEFNSLIHAHIKNDAHCSPLFLAHHNLHSIYLMPKKCLFSDYYNLADYIWIDGISIILILKITGYQITKNYRITFLDWQNSLFAQANNNNYHVFFLGGKNKVAENAVDNLSKIYPQIVFSHHHGYFDENDTKELMNVIKGNQIDLLFVGMGMPNQEEWIFRNRHNISAKVILPIGGYFDYFSIDTITPPRWVGKIGLEWLFRLISSPKRLWFRYLVEPWIVFYRLIKFLFIRIISRSRTKRGSY